MSLVFSPWKYGEALGMWHTQVRATNVADATVKSLSNLVDSLVLDGVDIVEACRVEGSRVT